MNTSIKCGIKGSYKVDIYSGRTLVESTDWFDNNITNVGYNHPFSYSFAECFRFLSFSESAQSTPLGDLTGLASPKGSFNVFVGNTNTPGTQSGTYIGWQGYEIGGAHDGTYVANTSSCGTRFTSRGFDLFRGWSIPTGAVDFNTVLNETLNIKSFMVSPSSGSDSKGNKAFSIVNRDITINSGYSATIMYQLSLQFDDYTGISQLASGRFATGSAATGVGNSETGLLGLWRTLSGIYRLVYPGMQFIDQIGSCVRSFRGDEMEPCVSDCKNTLFYLSPDISQFAVSPKGGSPLTLSNTFDEAKAYSSDGLMANYMNFNVVTSAESTEPVFPVDRENSWYYSGRDSADSSIDKSDLIESDTLSNIRLTNLLPISNYKHDATNASYKTTSFISALNYPLAFATPPGPSGFISSYENYGQKAIFSSTLKRMPYTGVTGTGAGAYQKTKFVTKKCFIPPLYSLGYNSRYGSLVLAYKSTPGTVNDMVLEPYMDFLFFDTSGRAANMPHYRLIPDIYLIERGSGVASVRFDITGVGGSSADGIKRINSVYGFMGAGVDTYSNSSGIDVDHPMLNNFITDSKLNFIPNGQDTYTMGYLFSGNPLNMNLGSNDYNNNTGWGGVYGVVASTGFYSSPYDTCLLDVPKYTGLGRTPSSTGEYIYWPTSGSGLGVRVTGVSYYLGGYGKVSDPAGFFANGANQLANDITYNGESILNNSSYRFNGTGIIRFTGVGPGFDMRLLTGVESGVTGYSFDSVYKRGSGYSAATIEYITGQKVTNSLYKDGVEISFYSSLKLTPTQWKKPSGVIRHVENIGNSGYRLFPNYAYPPNNAGINSYLPVTGGQYPGLSMFNGLELYLDFYWSGL